MNLLDFFSSHRAEIMQATLAHLFLVVVSMAIAVANRRAARNDSCKTVRAHVQWPSICFDTADDYRAWRCLDS